MDHKLHLRDACEKAEKWYFLQYTQVAVFTPVYRGHEFIVKTICHGHLSVTK